MPTARGARGLPASAATWPYVATLPCGMVATIPYTFFAKSVPLASIYRMVSSGPYGHQQQILLTGIGYPRGALYWWCGHLEWCPSGHPRLWHGHLGRLRQRGEHPEAHQDHQGY